MPAVPLLWAEFSIQFLIPALFLVIWVLNQVFGRAEAPPPVGRDRVGPRPLPPGPSRAPQPGPRSPQGAGAPGTRPGTAAAPRPATGRETGRSQGRGAPVRDRAPTSPGRSGPGPGPGSGELLRRPLPAPPLEEIYAIYDQGQGASRTTDRPTPAPVSASELRSVASPRSAGPAGTATIAGLLRSGVGRERFREAIIMAEVLRPPMTMRGRRGRRGRDDAGGGAREAGGPGEPPRADRPGGEG